MRALFIYWRVDADRADGAVAATAVFQSAQRARHAGLRTELYRRGGAAVGEPVTVMETYAAPAAETGIAAALQAELTSAANAALASWCQDQRHVEAFDVVAPPH